MPQVTLREITKENWRVAVKLKLTDEQQKFVAPNWYSIIQAHFEGFEVRGIYAGEEIVGFTMYGYEREDGELHGHIIRLMVATEQQAKGYGRAATLKIIEALKSNPECSSIYISFVLGNDIAGKLYADIGFEDTGKIEEGEHVYRMSVNKPPAS